MPDKPHEIGATEMRRRFSDTSFSHRVKEKTWEIFAQYGVMGLTSLCLLVGGAFYFKHAEERSNQTFQTQQRTIERQSEAFIDMVKQQATLVQQTNQVVENNTSALHSFKNELNTRMTAVEQRTTHVESAVKDLGDKIKERR